MNYSYIPQYQCTIINQSLNWDFVIIVIMLVGLFIAADIILYKHVLRKEYKRLKNNEDAWEEHGRTEKV